MGRLDNKVAIVTGGSRGMGRCYCQRFAEEGAKIALIYHTNAEAADEEGGKNGKALKRQSTVTISGLKNKFPCR